MLGDILYYKLYLASLIVKQDELVLVIIYSSVTILLIVYSSVTILLVVYSSVTISLVSYRRVTSVDFSVAYFYYLYILFASSGVCVT